VTVELKNDLAITGTLVAVDQYLNFKMKDIHVEDEEKFPHMVFSLVSSLFLSSLHPSLSLEYSLSHSFLPLFSPSLPSSFHL
jgi:hypothetical protein